MIAADIMTSNCASWLWILDFLEAFRQPWADHLHAVIEAGRSHGLDCYFRAGQSVSHVIFSTAERHGLEDIAPPPFRVTFGNTEAGRVFVALSDANLWFHEPYRKDIVTPENALPVLMSYLAELWASTRPDEPLPAALRQIA